MRPEVAQRLDRWSVDLDDEIEREADGRKIVDVVAQEGEVAFRHMEGRASGARSRCRHSV